MKIYTVKNGQQIVVEGETKAEISAQCIALGIQDPFAVPPEKKLEAMESAFYALPLQVVAAFEPVRVAILLGLKSGRKDEALALFDNQVIPHGLESAAASLRAAIASY